MNIRSFDLNLLRVLDALLREGSTVAAARAVGLSQPAVSAALGRLRHALGDPLFVRRGQGLEPTDHARALAPQVRALLDQAEEVLRGPEAFDPARAQASFKLSGSDFFAEMLMPDLARELTREAPGIRVQLVDLVADSSVESIERHGVDIALIPDMPLPGWIERQPVFRSAYAVVARRGAPRIAAAGVPPGGTIPLDLFCELGHVVFSPEGKLSATGDAALARIGRTRRVTMTMPVFWGVCRAVAASDLIALVPERLALRLAPALGLEVHRAPMPVEPTPIVMIWRRVAGASPAHGWIRDRIARTLAPLDVAGGAGRAP